jgi:tetraacyldisaccharide 4'-kinase
LGNGLTLPAGPLREPIHPGQIFPAIAVNDSEAPQGVRADRIFNFRVEPIGLSRINTEQSMSLAGFRELFGGERLCALAGIGEPGRFFDLLSRHGIATGRTIALADHAPIAADTLSSIDEPLIVMTAKDAVKCRDFADDRCWVLDVEVRPDPQLLDWLQGALLGNETA